MQPTKTRTPTSTTHMNLNTNSATSACIETEPDLLAKVLPLSTPIKEL